MRKWILLSLLLATILIIPSIPADKLVTQSNNGYGILTPKQEAIKVDRNYTMHIDVYDLSDGTYVSNESASCFLNVFNQRGETEYFSEFYYHGENATNALSGEWHKEIPAYVFDETGIYTYIIECDEDAGNLGGSRSEKMRVTFNGEFPSMSQSYLYVGVLALLILSFFVSLYFSIVVRWEDSKDDTGEVKSINYKKYAKIPLAFLSYFILLFIFAISEEASGYLYLNSAMVFFDMAFQIGIIMVAPALIVAAYFVVTRILWDKHAAEVLRRGMSLEERGGRR